MAIFAGRIGVESFVGDGARAFWGDSILVLPGHSALADSQHVAGWVKWLPTVVGVFGIALAYYMYMVRTELPARVAAELRAVYRFVYNKWYFDELYDRLFVRPAHYLGREFWREGDGTLIDGLGPDGVAAVARNLAERVSRLQTGYVYHYAFAMLIGVAGLVTLYLYTAAG